MNQHNHFEQEIGYIRMQNWTISFNAAMDMPVKETIACNYIPGMLHVLAHARKAIAR